MGSYISAPQISPQLLGISFLENHQFYFQDNKPVNTSDVSNTIRNAFRQQKISGEIMSLLHQAHKFSKEEILRKLDDLMEKYPGDLNVSRLAFDLAESKSKLLNAEHQIEELNKQISEKLNSSEYEEFVQKIKELKHHKRQLECRLEIIIKKYEEIKISFYTAKHTIEVLQEENDIIHKENDELKIQILSLRRENKLIQSRVHQLSSEIVFFGSQLMGKNDEILILQKAISVKDSELKDAILSIIKGTTDLDVLSNIIVELDERLLFSTNEIRASTKLLDEAEKTLDNLNQKLTILADSFQAKISQLETENSQLRQKLGH